MAVKGGNINYLEKSRNKRAVVDLTTFIIVAGLLTTSTYPAIYSPYFWDEAKHSGDDPAAARSDEGLPLSFSQWFRAMNGVSFVFSVSAIFSAVLTLITLQFFNTFDKRANDKKRELKPWASSILKRSYSLTWLQLLLSLGSAVTAAGIALFQFDGLKPGKTAFAFVLLTVVIGIVWWFILGKRGSMVADCRKRSELHDSTRIGTPIFLMPETAVKPHANFLPCPGSTMSVAIQRGTKLNTCQLNIFNALWSSSDVRRVLQNLAWEQLGLGCLLRLQAKLLKLQIWASALPSLGQVFSPSLGPLCFMGSPSGATHAYQDIEMAFLAAFLTMGVSYRSVDIRKQRVHIPLVQCHITGFSQAVPFTLGHDNEKVTILALVEKGADCNTMCKICFLSTPSRAMQAPRHAKAAILRIYVRCLKRWWKALDLS